MNEKTDPPADHLLRSGTEERDYLLERARTHRDLADKSDAAGPKSVHLRFEQMYQARAEIIDMVDPD